MQAWRTERNVRTANAQSALSLTRCKPGELKEMCGPYERRSRFVTALTVRTDRKSKMRTESAVRVYWTFVTFGTEKWPLQRGNRCREAVRRLSTVWHFDQVTGQTW